MTLRVTLSIVPFGDEADIRDIHEINISNLGLCGETYGEAPYEYGIELDKYKSDDYNVKINH